MNISEVSVAGKKVAERVIGKKDRAKRGNGAAAGSLAAGGMGFEAGAGGRCGFSGRATCALSFCN